MVAGMPKHWWVVQTSSRTNLNTNVTTLSNYTLQVLLLGSRPKYGNCLPNLNISFNPEAKDSFTSYFKDIIWIVVKLHKESK